MPMFKPIDIWGLYYLSIVVMSYKACICMVTYMGGGGGGGGKLREIFI